MYHHERNNSICWLCYWSTRLLIFHCQNLLLSVLFTILYGYCLRLVYCFHFFLFSFPCELLHFTVAPKEEKKGTQHPPPLIQTKPQSWYQRNESKSHLPKPVMSFQHLGGWGRGSKNNSGVLYLFPRTNRLCVCLFWAHILIALVCSAEFLQMPVHRHVDSMNILSQHYPEVFVSFNTRVSCCI